jgi:hypothetical protein
MMKRTILAAMLAVGVAGYVTAGEKCCAKKAAAAKSAEAQQLPAKVAEQLAAVPSYQRADELLKSWNDVPVKLAAMNEDDKAAIQAVGKKMSAHPAAAVFQPTLAYLNNSLALAVELDSAKHALKMQAKAAASDQGAVKADDAPACPKESAALVRKAGELVLAAYTAAGGEKGCSKRACSGDSNKVKLTAADGDAPVCPKAAAAAEKEGGGICAKSLSAKADAVVAESGKLLAQWQEANVTLASMDDSARHEVELASSEGVSKCPIGALMPETLSTAAELLSRAAKLDAQNEAEFAKNPEVAKHVSDEIRALDQSRRMVTNAALNVLEKTSLLAKPAKQIASAQ